MTDNVLFDLDGTLTDPFEGITNSIVYALSKFGIGVEDRRSLTDFIGPPLVDSFSLVYGFSPADAEKAVWYYREYFFQKGIFENSVYDGIIPVLEGLKARGKRLVIATSKPEVFALRIAEHFKISRYFNYIAGATLDSTRNTKAEVIKYALHQVGISSAVMVGDRNHDILGAKANNLKSVGVLYGYGSLAELKSAGADYIARTPADILEIIK